MNITTTILRAIMCFWLVTAPMTALAEDTFTIVTKPSLGFKEGSKVYELGEAIESFLSSFGPAEKIQEDTYDESDSKYFTLEEYSRGYLSFTKTYYYVNDGVIVTENKNGMIKGVVFYVVPSESLNAAKVKTEEGISSGASLREIVKAYGQPFRRKEDNLLGYQNMEIYYKYGNDVLSFRFRDGVLETIQINAEYLSFLQ